MATYPKPCQPVLSSLKRGFSGESQCTHYPLGFYRIHTWHIPLYWAGEWVQQLAYCSLEGPSSAPSTHLKWLIAACHSSPRAPDALFWPLRHPHLCAHTSKKTELYKPHSSNTAVCLSIPERLYVELLFLPPRNKHSLTWTQFRTPSVTEFESPTFFYFYIIYWEIVPHYV